MKPSPAASYTPAAKGFHWVTFFLMIGVFGFAWIMSEAWAAAFIPRGEMYMWHKTLGFLILLTTFLRLFWRVRNAPPPFPAAMASWEKWFSGMMHKIFYGLLILVPLSGWLLVSTSPYPTLLFGVIPVPRLPFLPDPENAQTLRRFFSEAHETVANALLLLIVLHIASSLKHHFVDRDNMLMRIAPVFMKGFLFRLQARR